MHNIRSKAWCVACESHSKLPLGFSVVKSVKVCVCNELEEERDTGQFVDFRPVDTCNWFGDRQYAAAALR